jgi:hypothetical protein
MKIEECDGYKKLRMAVERDIKERDRSREEEEALFSWVIERARHYAEKTGLAASDILDAWEKKRDYWHLNYYNEANQPKINNETVRVFEDVDEFRASLKGKGFRCPNCGGMSGSPTACDTMIKDKSGKPCDWKSYGLLGTMEKGVYVYIKSALQGCAIFMPVAWEKEEKQA